MPPWCEDVAVDFLQVTCDHTCMPVEHHSNSKTEMTFEEFEVTILYLFNVPTAFHRPLAVLSPSFHRPFAVLSR